MLNQIRLRPLQMNDLDAYYQIVKQPSVARGAGFPLVKSRNQAFRMLKVDLKSGLSLAIIINEHLTGVISLYATIGPRDIPDWRRLELGYFIAPHAQGNGYMTMALSLVIRMMHKSRVEQLEADVDENNAASVYVLHKNGFVNYHSILNLSCDHADLIFERKV